MIYFTQFVKLTDKLIVFLGTVHPAEGETLVDLVMTIREVAQALKLDDETVLAMATDGELPCFRVRGQWRVRRADFDVWLANQVIATRRELAEHGAALQIESTRQELPVQPPTLNLEKPTEERIVSDTHLNDLTERVAQEELHQRFVQALGASRVRSHGPFLSKPFEADLVAPLPQRIRVYMYNATRPPGGRPLGEHKVQLIVPGQGRGDRGSFDSSGGRIVLLVGYAAEEDVFVLWDAGLYTDFAWSRNVQVKGHTIIDATAGKIATQERQLRPASGRTVVETVLAVKARNLAEAIQKRMELTRERLLRD